MSKIFLSQIGPNKKGLIGEIGVAITKDVTLTNAEMLALRATPKEIIPAPGAGKMIELISATLVFDYTAAYTETADNLGFLLGAAGTSVATVETTGFLTATADTATKATLAAASNIALTAADNKSIVLQNTGDGELGGGNAANLLKVSVLYRIVDTV